MFERPNRNIICILRLSITHQHLKILQKIKLQQYVPEMCKNHDSRNVTLVRRNDWNSRRADYRIIYLKDLNCVFGLVRES